MSINSRLPGAVSAYAASPSSTTLPPLLAVLTEIGSLSSVADRRSANATAIKQMYASLRGIRGGTGDDIPHELRRFILGMMNEVNVSDFLAGGEDNLLRKGLFESYLENADYDDAANIIAGTRMVEIDEPVTTAADGEMEDGEQGSSNRGQHPKSHLFTPTQACDTYIQASECYLFADDAASAENYVNKAGAYISRINSTSSSESWSVVMRYKSVFARILDSNRKFQQAGVKYHDLSLTVPFSTTIYVPPSDLLSFLGMGAVCAVLSPSGHLRERLLQSIVNDPRFEKIEEVEGFQGVRGVATKMCRGGILSPDETKVFATCLKAHQKATTAEGSTLLQSAVLQHNISALTALYKNLSFVEMGKLLGLSVEDAQSLVAKMIGEKRVMGKIDEVEGIVYFKKEPKQGEGRVAAVCQLFNECVAEIEKE